MLTKYVTLWGTTMTPLMNIDITLFFSDISLIFNHNNNNENLFFNPTISPNLINIQLLYFSLVLLKSQTLYIWVPPLILDMTELYISFTGHLDTNLIWVVTYFINYKVCVVIDLAIITLKIAVCCNFFSQDS